MRTTKATNHPPYVTVTGQTLPKAHDKCQFYLVMAGLVPAIPTGFRAACQSIVRTAGARGDGRVKLGHDGKGGMTPRVARPTRPLQLEPLMKHWRIDDVAWHRFDPTLVNPDIIPLVKAAAMVERNGRDYAIYLSRVFTDDPAFRGSADRWAEEEVQHGDALARWATLADPEWDYGIAFDRYRAGYKLPLDADASVRGSRTGELIARCMVETGTSSYYTALAEATEEPVLKQVCKLIAADEYRHFKLFYDHMRRYLARENIGIVRRLRIALGRIGESEDDELAYAYYCGNKPASTPYQHKACTAAYMAGAIGLYRFRHIERGTGMILKAVGLPPRGRLSAAATRVAWRLLQWRHHRFARQAAA